MYEELIKRLRAVVGAREEKCDGCPHKEDYPCCVDCLDKMHRQAADAIEELQAAVDGYEANTDVEFVKEDGHERIRFVPKWVSVKERLPEKGGKYLTAFKDGCVTDNFFMAPTGEKFKEAHPNGKWYWNETDRGGITHWMPLPTPPKEETE